MRSTEKCLNAECLTDELEMKQDKGKIVGTIENMPWSAINLPRGCARVVVHCMSKVGMGFSRKISLVDY